jgi:hypothetical protein
MAQLGGAGACLEALLLSQGHLVLEQDAEPLQMVESIAFRVGRRVAQLLDMPSRPSSRRRSIVGCCSKVVLLNGSSGNRGCWRAGSARCLRCASPSWSRADARDQDGDALIIERGPANPGAKGDRTMYATKAHRG